MSRILVLALLSTTIAFPFVAHASIGVCDSQGAPALGKIEIGNGDPASTFYIDDRFIAGPGVWTYQESNGIFVGGNVDADLQRGGSSQIVPDDNESCVDDPDIAPDTLIE